VAPVAANRSRGLKMSRKNSHFADAVVGQKTVGRLCVCPVLTNPRNALAGTLGELLEKFSESLVESDVCELASNEFTLNPCLGLGCGGVINPQGALRFLPLRHNGSSPCVILI
jgi:hypothetical protein